MPGQLEKLLSHLNQARQSRRQVKKVLDREYLRSIRPEASQTQQKARSLLLAMAVTHYKANQFHQLYGLHKHEHCHLSAFRSPVAFLQEPHHADGRLFFSHFCSNPLDNLLWLHFLGNRLSEVVVPQLY